MAASLQMTFSDAFTCMKTTVSLKFVPTGPIYNKLSDTPLPELMLTMIPDLASMSNPKRKWKNRALIQYKDAILPV